MSKNSKKPIHEKMISQLELPKDLMLGAAIVTIELEDSLVKIQTKNCRLQILGAHLTVEYYTNEEMKIVGLIDSVSYEY